MYGGVRHTCREVHFGTDVVLRIDDLVMQPKYRGGDAKPPLLRTMRTYLRVIAYVALSVAHTCRALVITCVVYC